MARTLEDWVETEVRPLQDRPISWLAENHFFRDPMRATRADPDCFLSPADGIVLYQREVEPDECVIDIKGRPHTLRQALHDPQFDRPSLVIGVFMTFYDVHVNRIPHTGRLSHRLLEAVHSRNLPMLDMERELVDQLGIDPAKAEYLHENQRVLNRIDAAGLGLSYYVLQIADYDVNAITPFDLRQHVPVQQGRRFSQIRYGSQVDLIIPLVPHLALETAQQPRTHVEAGIDPLVHIHRTQEENP